MRRFWIFATLLLLFAILTTTATPVAAQGGRTVFGQSVTIESGKTVYGDLVVVGGPLTIERGGLVEGDVTAVGGPISIAGRVEGDVKAMGGPITIAGQIDGDVAVWGGPVNLRDSAVVEGDVVVRGGPLNRSEGAVVKGEIVEGFRFTSPEVPAMPPVTPRPQIEVSTGTGFLSLLFRLFTNGLLAAGLALIALLLLILAPDHTNAIKQMTADQPIASVGVGCLTSIVAIVVLPLLFISICGIPIALLLLFGLVVAVFFGWIALGTMIGERLLAAIDTERPLPLVSGVFGVLLITLLWRFIPFLGSLLFVVGGCWGLGAVVLARGGIRRYPTHPGGRARRPALEPTSGGSPTGVQTSLTQPAGRPAPEGLDDLQAIEGIGPVYEQLLREAGIRTYNDLASRSPELLVEAVAAPNVIPASVEMARRWIEEAQRLAELQS